MRRGLLRYSGSIKSTQYIGMGLQVAIDRLPFYLLTGALVNNEKVLSQPDQPRSLADDVVGQTVESEHAEAARQQPSALDELIDACAEVLNSRIGERDNQHFAVVHWAGACQLLHQLGGQAAQSIRLAAAGHRADTEPPPFVPEYLLLCRAQIQFSGHEIVARCLVYEPVSDSESRSPRGGP